MIDETLRASVLAPWGARIHEFDLQVGDFVIPKEVNCIILERFRIFTENGGNDPVTMFILYLPLAVFSFLVKLSSFA